MFVSVPMIACGNRWTATRRGERCCARCIYRLRKKEDGGKAANPSQTIAIKREKSEFRQI